MAASLTRDRILQVHEAVAPAHNVPRKKSAPLGADVDAILAGASEADADNIARAIEARPWPTYEERMAVFSPAGPWKSSRESTTG
jgi:hypothetical protein